MIVYFTPSIMNN